MTKGILGLIGVLLVVACLDTVTVLAASSRNPFSSYNVSGVNYGAQQWERTHGKKKSPQASGRRHRR
jgi:hypothetical protein